MLLSLRSISKRFGPVLALDGVSFELAPGEVHALLGENGAGKSTLMGVAYGLVAPEAGTITVDGAPATIRSPRDARRLGLGMVHQHFTSVPAFTVGENVALAADWPARPRENTRRVAELCARLGLSLDPEARAGALSVALRQRLEIVKALAPGARALLLDEPTAVLAPSEVAELLETLRGFARAGGAVVLITHKLDEALGVADRVTVLRAGRVVLSGPAAQQTRDSLARAMLGGSRVEGRGSSEGGQRSKVEGRRSSSAALASIRLPGAPLDIHPGDIVGIAAVEGNGQRELMRMAAGVMPAPGGAVERSGEAVLIPEDRTIEALLPGFTLTENTALGLSDRPGWSERGLMRWGEARERTAALLRDHDVRATGPDALARALSGGNQQKLVVARALARGPALIVAENPTRGLDLAATAAVHQALRDAASRGAAVLLHSSDLDEVLDLATRVVVMTGGRLDGWTAGRLVEMAPGASRDDVGAAMLGGLKVEGQRSKVDGE